MVIKLVIIATCCN